MARYEAGETLASIARTYDCSPPAISYVVSRSRARQPGPEAAAKTLGGSEPQLIKGSAPDGAAAKPPIPGLLALEAAANGHDRHDRSETAPGVNHHRDNQPERESNGGRPPISASISPANGGNGASHPVAAPNGDHRRTLHLSLGNPVHRDGGNQPAEIRPEPEPTPALPGPSVALPVGAGPHNGQNGAVPNGATHMPPPGYPEHLRRSDSETAPRKDGGTFIDQELRTRVDGDIAAFLAAFDAALEQDTQENRAALREATDRLLRAGARTRIELERLEARLPLPPRSDGRAGEIGWRPR